MRYIKYLGGLHNDIRRQITLFKPKTIDEACVHAQHREFKKRKGFPNGLKQFEQQGASNEGEEGWVN